MNTRKEKRVHEVFESISSHYDRMNGVISFNMHNRWRKDMMKRTNLTRHANVLDVCAGTADWTIANAKQIQEGSAVGLDFSERMLEVGREKIKNAGLNNVQLIQGNANALPFEDHSFDVVTIGFGLRNVPDPHCTLEEMIRVLKPGGQALCLETSQPENVLFKPVYHLYFQHVMPRLGQWFAKSDKYRWLNESTVMFPNKRKLAHWFEVAGFERVGYCSYAGGAAAGHWGFKPSEGAGRGML
ncbi:demethylmenaquinone methyltransferase/2-methoxy-6-polyprenyl-1,4-benzoquinol methylase [Geomicrobium halophilum]|uniref:Demethylmenaquinone methyltransferase n=1 Tax=Geomicrobium halophilum TaxID=549000 RepID=A0A841PRW3_9BACL|nr:demethylmenaquinone methyltransferase [Geomicrobium halophilum]MBB6449031.1 demethylmenaquinone methyltransferase/2-methoxy-6-polyprenyl-1,4-benzoquinol methylase [Geomicrobium halophilum]